MFRLTITACVLAILDPFVTGSADHSFIKQPCLAITTTLFQPLGCSSEGPSYISTNEPTTIKRISVQLDSSAPSRQHDPWSHSPVCTGWLPDINDTICVYTAADFMNGRGISIITTASSAEDISSLAVIRQRLPAAVQDEPNLSSTTKISGKGRGLMASANAQRGDLMRTQAPVVLLREGVSAALSLPELEEFMRIAVSRLPNSTQNLLRQLSARRFKYRPGGESLFLTGVMVNHAGLEIPIAGIEHYGMFDELGLINHSCGPNAFRRADASTLSLQITAARDIEQAEEITISYFPHDQMHLHLSPRSIRQGYLLDNQLMQCLCSRCDNAYASEATTAQIVDLQRKMTEDVRDPHVIVAEASELVDLYKSEGLDILLADVYETVYRAMTSIGDVSAAAKYAEMALELSVMDGKVTNETRM